MSEDTLSIDYGSIEEELGIDNELLAGMEGELDNRYMALEQACLQYVSAAPKVNNLAMERYANQLDSILKDYQHFSFATESEKEEHVKRTFGEVQEVLSVVFKQYVDYFQKLYTFFDLVEGDIRDAIEDLEEQSWDVLDISVSKNKYMFYGNSKLCGDWKTYSKQYDRIHKEVAPFLKMMGDYTDKHVFAGIKAFFDIVTLNEDAYREEVKEFFKLVDQIKTNMSATRTTSQMNMLGFATDMYLGMGRIVLHVPRNYESDKKDEYKYRALVPHISFYIDRYSKFSIPGLNRGMDLDGVKRKELIKQLKDTLDINKKYKKHISLLTKLSDVQKFLQLQNIVMMPLPTLVFAILSKRYALMKVSAISVLMTNSGIFNFTRGNAKQLVSIAKKAVRQGKKEER